jgi:hypothetical protein
MLSFIMGAMMVMPIILFVASIARKLTVRLPGIPA